MCKWTRLINKTNGLSSQSSPTKEEGRKEADKEGGGGIIHTHRHFRGSYMNQPLQTTPPSSPTTSTSAKTHTHLSTHQAVIGQFATNKQSLRKTVASNHRPPHFFSCTPVASSTGHHDNPSRPDWEWLLQLGERVGVAVYSMERKKMEISPHLHRKLSENLLIWMNLCFSKTHISRLSTQSTNDHLKIYQMQVDFNLRATQSLFSCSKADTRR